jgi:plastocyanin
MVSALEQGKGYLNVWVDGNRDGDWADVQQCAPMVAGSTAAVALEHVVVDFPVDAVSLGAGLHMVDVPTSGPVPWPAELAADPAWVRVTLSEKAANKPFTAGALSYGDGRGYDDLPFRFGETEDYLWRPARDPKNGPDVAIRKQGIALSGAPVTMTVASEGGRAAERIAWVVEYANRGNEAATGVEIADDLALGGTLDQLEIKMEPELEYTLDGTRVLFAVGELPPGKHGRIVLITGADVQNSGVYTNVAAIRADVDADAENNRADAVVKIGLRAPVIVEPGDGTTCENEITVRGRAVPGTTVDLYVDGGLVASPATDATGRWSHALTLVDGEHTLYAVARLGALVSPASRTVNVTVNSSMAWSPLSLRFTNQLGWSHRPVDEEGRTDAAGWSIRLRPGATYTVSVKLCCAAPSASVQLVISGTTPLELTDGDGDQVYSGVFTASEVRHAAGSMMLTVQCGDTSFTGSGVQLIDPEGQVYDVKTAGTLAGAAVACLQAQGTAADAGAAAAYDLWPAADYGQVNPQSTLADGQFNFFTPAGVYRLAVSRTGYQPYRSTDIAVVDEAVHVDVPLTPIVDRAADHVVVITDYGFEPAFLEVGAGEVVEWVNMGIGGHTATSLKAQTGVATVGAAAFDSGLLLAGERYRFEFVEAGGYAVVDRANPANVADILVVNGGEFLFLPAVRR